MSKLYQRGEDGFPVGSDSVLREAYGQIPDTDRFQHHRSYGYEVPKEVHGWSWSTTFNAWRAHVTFKDGWTGVTSPAPWRKHHDACPVCQTKLSRYSPNGFDLIFECDGHHRHLIRGITGEYMTLSPIVPRQNLAPAA